MCVKGLFSKTASLVMQKAERIKQRESPIETMASHLFPSILLLCSSTSQHFVRLSRNMRDAVFIP